MYRAFYHLPISVSTADLYSGHLSIYQATQHISCILLSTAHLSIYILASQHLLHILVYTMTAYPTWYLIIYYAS